MQQPLAVGREELEEVELRGSRWVDVMVERYGVGRRAHRHEPVLEAPPPDVDGLRARHHPEDHVAPLPVRGHVCQIRQRMEV
jgi:hypothetical protein